MDKASRRLRLSVKVFGRLCLAALILFLYTGKALAQDFKDKQASALEPLSIHTNAVAPRRFIAVHGRRSLIDGYSENGLEVWAYPLQLIRGYKIGFLPEGTTSEISGQTILRRITYQPESILRTYIGPDFIVREKLFVPLHTPGAIVTYTVESRKPVDIVVHFVPVLNLMWPAALGGQDTSWSPASSGYVMSEPTHRFSAVIGSTNVVAHDEIFNSTEPSATPGGMAFTVRTGSSDGSNTATVVIASADNMPNGNLATTDTSTLVTSLTHSTAQMEQRAVAHYANRRASTLQIETPNKIVNRDLAWAAMALDQAWVCNPYLGCGLVAGYGPTRGARRPQYAWFFSGDALVAIRALVSTSDYSLARQALEFIARYQDKESGMIWHEMSQSAGLIDWAGKYPYMFVHVDITFQYLSAIANYVATSGDKKFLQEHWSSIDSAYNYCRSLIDPEDGLPRIPSTKEGGDEQDRMSDELTLSASWVKASEAFARMATWTDRTSEAQQANAYSMKARRSIAKLYWDSKDRFWIDGHSPDRKAIFNRSSSGNVVISEHVFSSAQEQELLNQLASSNFQTDWGTRSVALNSKTFDPDSYAKGSVWAVGTANIAMEFWLNHRPATAFPIWNALVPWSSLDSMGHMDEVLAGDYYHEQTESVPEQTWSSAAFLHATVQGLLGLEVDALKNQIIFSPHLPSNWNSIAVRNINLTGSMVTLSLIHNENGLTLEARNNGGPFQLIFDPEIPQGAHLASATENGKTIPAQIEQHLQDTHARVQMEIPNGTSRISIGYEGGVSLVLPAAHLLLGNSSRAIKVIHTELNNRTFILDAEVDFAQSTTFQLKTPWKILQVHGATWKALSAGTYELTIVSSESHDGLSICHPVQIRVDLAL